MTVVVTVWCSINHCFELFLSNICSLIIAIFVKYILKKISLLKVISVKYFSIFNVISIKYMLKYLLTVESNFCQIFVHLKAGLSPSEVVWGIKFSRGNDFLSKFSTFSFEKMPQRVAEVVSMGSLLLTLNRNNIYDTDIGSNKYPQFSVYHH